MSDFKWKRGNVNHNIRPGNKTYRACESAAPNLMSRQCAEGYDKLITSAVEEKLGELPCLDELASRLQRVKVHSDDRETWTLDGVPLIEVYPVDFKTVRDGDSVKLVGTQKYRVLIKPNPTKPNQTKK